MLINISPEAVEILKSMPDQLRECTEENRRVCETLRRALADNEGGLGRWDGKIIRLIYEAEETEGNTAKCIYELMNTIDSYVERVERRLIPPQYEL